MCCYGCPATWSPFSLNAWRPPSRIGSEKSSIASVKSAAAVSPRGSFSNAMKVPALIGTSSSSSLRSVVGRPALPNAMAMPPRPARSRDPILSKGRNRQCCFETGGTMGHNPAFLALVEEARSRIQECTIEQVKRKIDGGAPCEFIDVREDHEYAQDHARGARHLGRGILERDIETLIP